MKVRVLFIVTTFAVMLGSISNAQSCEIKPWPFKSSQLSKKDLTSLSSLPRKEVYSYLFHELIHKKTNSGLRKKLFFFLKNTEQKKELSYFLEIVEKHAFDAGENYKPSEIDKKELCDLYNQALIESEGEDI